MNHCKSLTKSYHRPPGLIRSFCLGPPFLSGKTWGTCAVTVDPVDLDVFVTSDSFLWFFFSFFALFSSWSFLRLSLDFTAVPALLSWLISSSLLDNNQWKQFKIKLFIITDPQSTPYLLTGKIVSLQVMHDGYLECQEGINLNFYQDIWVIFSLYLNIHHSRLSMIELDRMLMNTHLSFSPLKVTLSKPSSLMSDIILWKK